MGTRLGRYYEDEHRHQRGRELTHGRHYDRVRGSTQILLLRDEYACGDVRVQHAG